MPFLPPSAVIRVGSNNKINFSPGSYDNFEVIAASNFGKPPPVGGHIPTFHSLNVWATNCLSDSFYSNLSNPGRIISPNVRAYLVVNPIQCEPWRISFHCNHWGFQLAVKPPAPPETRGGRFVSPYRGRSGSSAGSGNGCGRPPPAAPAPQGQRSGRRWA